MAEREGWNRNSDAASGTLFGNWNYLAFSLREKGRNLLFIFLFKRKPKSLKKVCALGI
jgi:hypothetical protein